jgi:hypothetical protein
LLLFEELTADVDFYQTQVRKSSQHRFKQRQDKQACKDTMGVFTATMAVVAAATAGPTPPHPDAASACAAMNVSTLISIMHGEERCTPLPLDHTMHVYAHTHSERGSRRSHHDTDAALACEFRGRVPCEDACPANLLTSCAWWFQYSVPPSNGQDQTRISDEIGRVISFPCSARARHRLIRSFLLPAHNIQAS